MKIERYIWHKRGSFDHELAAQSSVVLVDGLKKVLGCHCSHVYSFSLLVVVAKLPLLAVAMFAELTEFKSFWVKQDLAVQKGGMCLVRYCQEDSTDS